MNRNSKTAFVSNSRPDRRHLRQHKSLDTASLNPGLMCRENDPIFSTRNRYKGDLEAPEPRETYSRCWPKPSPEHLRISGSESCSPMAPGDVAGGAASQDKPSPFGRAGFGSTIYMAATRDSNVNARKAPPTTLYLPVFQPGAKSF